MEREARSTHSLPSGVLAIAGLSSLAFAQPVYDLLRRSPEFFAIRDLYMGDLLALVVLLAGLPTLAFAAPALLARLVRPGWSRPAAAAATGTLTAIIGLQALRALPAAVAVPAAVLAGAATGWGYIRFRGVRSFGLLVSAATAVVPALLILDGDVRRSAARPVRSIDVEQADTGARAPIVLVIFDEWSLTSILDPEGGIDRQRLPNLAALADTATWYPNATAASDVSELAVPAMLSGSQAEQGRLPTASEYPVNLFTLLEPSHDLYAREPISSLCPIDANLLARPRSAFRARFGLLASDLAIVWLNLTLPPAWTGGLPSVTQTWSGFGQDDPRTAVPPPTNQPVPRALFHLRNTDRAAAFRRFVDAIAQPGDRPGFYFLHSMLPHVPWEYLPTGRRYYAPRGGLHGLRGERWTTDPWPVVHHQKRYLMQVQFVDRLIGELVDQLESAGLFDESLVVITADHGVAFQPGRSRRLLDPDDPSGHQSLDLAAVPLLVKAPFQDQAAIDEQLLSLTELTPRILELAGANTQHSMPDGRSEGSPLIVGKYAGPIPVSTEREFWRAARTAEQAALLGAANDPGAIGARPELHGLSLAKTAHLPGETTIELEAAFAWDQVDPDQAVLPALVEGVFESGAPVEARSVAVALNGRVAATVIPHQTVDGRNRIAAVVPESRFRPGLNQVDVFLVSEPEEPLELEHVGRPPLFVYEQSWNDRGRLDALLRKSRSALDAGAERIPLVPQKTDEGLIGFLDEGYEPRDGIQGWALDVARPGSTRSIVAFLAGRQFSIASASSVRPDVAERFGQEHLHSGFLLSPIGQTAPGRYSVSQDEVRDTLRREGIVAYALSNRGVATRLRFTYRPLQETRREEEILPVTDGRRLAVRPAGDRGFGGAVDLVTRAGQRTAIEGWAADLERRERPRQIVIYRDGEFLASLGANQQRPDVAAAHGDERLLRTGFRGTVPGAPDPATFSERHRVFAVMLRGVAVELPVRPPEGPAVQQ